MANISTARKKYRVFSLVLVFLLFIVHGCKEPEQPNLSHPQISQFSSSPKVTKAEKITFAVFGDNRPSSPLLSQPQAFKKILAQIKKTQPDVVISTGDSVYGSPDSFTYEKQYQEFVSLIKEMGLPFFVALGNHDARNRAGIKLYQKYLSSKTYFSFKKSGALFIILDTESEPGIIGKEQLLWLEKVLKETSSSNIFVFLHRPPFSLMNPQAEKNKHLSFVDLKNRDKLVKILKRANVKTVFAGHEHFFNLSRFGNLTQIIAGCAGSPPYTDFSHGGFPHFVLVEVEKDRFKIKVVDENGRSYAPEEFKTPIFP